MRITATAAAIPVLGDRFLLGEAAGEDLVHGRNGARDAGGKAFRADQAAGPRLPQIASKLVAAAPRASQRGHAPSPVGPEGDQDRRARPRPARSSRSVSVSPTRQQRAGPSPRRPARPPPANWQRRRALRTARVSAPIVAQAKGIATPQPAQQQLAPARSGLLVQMRRPRIARLRAAPDRVQRAGIQHACARVDQRRAVAASSRQRILRGRRHPRPGHSRPARREPQPQHRLAAAKRGVRRRPAGPAARRRPKPGTHALAAAIMIGGWNRQGCRPDRRPPSASPVIRRKGI